MNKIPFVLLIFISSLYANGAAIAQNLAIAEKAILVQDTITIDESYQNPRKSLEYDKSSIVRVPIDQKSIEAYQVNEDFNYKEALPEDNWWTRLKQKLNDLYHKFIHWLLDGKEAVGIWAMIVKALPYLLIVAVVTLIVWLFLKLDSGNLLMEKIKVPETLLSDDELLIQRSDLQKLLDQAIRNKKYRIAVRYYYLMTLQKMSSNDLINWEVQKTNHDYINEIQNQNTKNQFSKVTAIYDYIWYGNFEVDVNAFAKAESSFKTLYSSL
ncbi:DUF4129 domain-containing protein [Dokdonia sp. Hel_I_53]|uniref:DUF4129 domain-containing protein n=1 Tax=Dokdonia sp. Hel_I_53 TaxID=1566287 RepID=UPI001199670D|nr:DUF4129 domain-containing protein [Dokdonia sp. Hel_I_53]TVZ51124.1 hypothetical protein OD90_0260 [Dokdonia sp. Hel_I_53]